MKKAILVTILLIIVIVAVAGGVMWLKQRGAHVDAAVPAMPTDASKPPSATRGQDAPAPNVTHRYPRIVGGNFDHEDQTSLDETVAMREFKIPLESGEVFYVTAAYRSYLGSRTDFSDKITALADLDAAFSEAYSMPLPSPQPGVTLRLHVGDFAQDYCGEVDLVYTMQTESVMALLMGDQKTQTAMLADAPCVMERDDTENFCEQRTQCLNSYLAKKLKDEPLDSPVLRAFSELRLQ